MKEHQLKIKDFILDEIESIELVGEQDTVDITVDGTHMFFANNIYTHNSAISSDVVTNDQMGGSIKKSQIGHIVISIAKTLTQKESGLATMALLKSRISRDGIVFENCIFDNAKMLISTEQSETLLGFEHTKEKRSTKRAAEIYQTVAQRNLPAQQQAQPNPEQVNNN